MARPISWPSKIAAAPEAIAFYKALSEAAAAGVFADCHVYSGATNDQGVPVLLDPGSKKPVAAPIFIGAYLGEAMSGRRRCNTRGCLNPFHYATQEQSRALHPSVRPAPDLQRDEFPVAEWVELIGYMKMKKEARKISLKWCEKNINPEDIPKELLPMVFEKVPKEWKE